MSVDCISIENVYCNLIGWFFLIFSNVGWRLGLQQITGLLITTFLLGTFYRSASLYHPQRRAILHLKTQKRKIKNKDKEKNKLQDDRPPFFEFTALKSRTVQIILLSTFLSHMGIFSPLFFLVSINSMCVDNIRVSRFTFHVSRFLLIFIAVKRIQGFLRCLLCRFGCEIATQKLMMFKQNFPMLDIN